MSEAPVTDAQPIADGPPEVPVFLCYRRRDGQWYAEWLYQRLEKLEYTDKDGRRRVVRPYYDKTAPGVSDWKSLHSPSLQTARALFLICTPGIATDLSRRGQKDWVYEELRWWVKNRKSPPIVIDTTGEGDRWLPALLSKKWPDVNRIDLTQAEAEQAEEAGNHEYVARICERLTGSIRELEQRTLFEDLERSRRQAERLRAALAVAIGLFVIAASLAFYANQKRREAVEQRKIAIEQSRIAQERQLLAARLLVQIYLGPALRSNPALRDQDGAQDDAPPPADGTPSTSTAHILALVNQAIQRKQDRQFLLAALDVLMCYGPYRGLATEVAFQTLFSKVEPSADAEVRSRLNTLSAAYEADKMASGALRILASSVDRSTRHADAGQKRPHLRRGL